MHFTRIVPMELDRLRVYLVSPLLGCNSHLVSNIMGCTSIFFHKEFSPVRIYPDVGELPDTSIMAIISKQYKVYMSQCWLEKGGPLSLG